MCPPSQAPLRPHPPGVAAVAPQWRRVRLPLSYGRGVDPGAAQGPSRDGAKGNRRGPEEGEGPQVAAEGEHSWVIHGSVPTRGIRLSPVYLR